MPQPHNYIHLIGANALPTPTLGQTNPDYDFTYLYAGGTESAVAVLEPDVNQRTFKTSLMNKENTCHEFGHDWWVNKCVLGDSGHHENMGNPVNAWCDTPGHCAAPYQDGSSERCIMYEPAALPGNVYYHDRTTGAARFDIQELLTGPCANPFQGPLTGAIRTEPDPE